MTITLYVKENCPTCLLVENYLLARNLDFKEIIVDNSEVLKEIEKLTGEKRLPVIKTEEKIIVGFQQEELRIIAS